MVHAVFLCDKQWKIINIKQCSPYLEIKEGDFLTDFASGKENLEAEEKQYMRRLFLPGQKTEIPALIYTYREGNLIVLASISNDQDFMEFCVAYPKYQEWAKDHLLGLFHNEYYRIQQINNELVDAQRKLMRSNKKLEQALEENAEINQKLEQARLLAEHASSSKTRFLANMSHDIRTPMNAIIGFTELMQHNLDHPAVLDNYIKKVRSSSQYLLDLINDILDLSKIENGSLALRFEPMDMGAQIEQVITIIRSQITKKRLKLTVDGESAWYGYVMGDPVRLRQILMNVFSNAIKYTPEEGSIDFVIRESDETEQKRNYQFIVEDSGIGMSKEFLEHIFDPFARAEASAREIQGTGLGMAITKSIIDAMHGTIHVSSVPGKGSTFEITLPFEVCQSDSLSEADAQTQKSDAEKLSLKGMHFLCAEDNELNAEILEYMLKMEGADCSIYENGKQLVDAFEAVTDGQYDAILMDVQMPVMNGYEATKQIRESRNPLGKKIPVIAMTANAFSEDEQNCLKAGMNAHIAKPLDFDRLKEILGKLI